MNSISVLIVDDDDNYRSTLYDVLIENNLDIDMANDGLKAVEMVKNKAYDVVLMDVNMPGMGGVEAFAEIKKIRPKIKVLLMTASNIESLQHLLDQGVSTIMQKPFELSNIVEMISSVKKKKLVLVVDDNENDRNSLSEILTSKDFRVVTAQTGLEGLEQVKNNNFDVVLLDMKLPDMEGIEVLDKIRQDKPALSVIAITGYTLDGIIENITEHGVYTCLLKPIDVEVLLSEVNSAIENQSANTAAARTIPSQKILLVEDDDGIRETTEAILTEEGYNVKSAPSVEDAVKLIETENFDMVISDLSLGNGSGLSLVDPVRKKDPSTIFLLMTGAGTMETALEAIKKDIDEYILKPVEPAELVHKVKNYIEKRKTKKEKEVLVLKLQESNNKLRELVKVDELTGAFNRRFLFEQLHTEMQRAKRQRLSLAIMMCDVDGFKKYNDQYGHPEGDKLLKEIVAILQDCVRQYVDQVFRYGGDEFAILVRGISKYYAIKLAGRIVKKIKDTLSDKNIGLSIGVACFDGVVKEAESLNELIHIADNKLYKAKRSGGNKAII